MKTPEYCPKAAVSQTRMHHGELQVKRVKPLPLHSSLEFYEPPSNSVRNASVGVFDIQGLQYKSAVNNIVLVVK